MAAVNTMAVLMSRLFEEESPLKPDPLYIFHSLTWMIYSTVLKINGITMADISKRRTGFLTGYRHILKKSSNIVRVLRITMTLG